MAHFWLRHETRPDEARAALTPEGAAALIAAGHRITVEDSPTRVFPTADYREAGAAVADMQGWRRAPEDAVILGLKELPEDTGPLTHRHLMFGHAYKGQFAGRDLMRRFGEGGGTLLDMEYLVGEDGRRVAAFGYWAGYAGAAVTLIGLAAQRAGSICPAVSTFASAAAMREEVATALAGHRPRVLIVGCKGRVGNGVQALCEALDLAPECWDTRETDHGGPFPQIAATEVFFNCILAVPGTPVFFDGAAADGERALRIIGDIACDPDSDYNPVPLYEAATTWAEPVVRVRETPPLDIMAIDNLPSLLPRESAEDFAGQLLPHLHAFDSDENGVWARAEATYRDNQSSSS